MIPHLKITTLSVLILITSVITSCTTIVVSPVKKDNGNHYGWYKNTNNPHHPMHNKKSTGQMKSSNNGKGNNGKGNNGKGNKK